MNNSMIKTERTSNLEQALHSFLGQHDAVHELARILLLASPDNRIPYEVIEQIVGNEAEEVILLGYEWRILVPARTSTTVDWENSVMLFKAGELYKLPDIIRNLVRDAVRTGEWKTEHAITTYFRSVGEPAWQKMAVMILEMYNAASHYRIDGAMIARIADVLGLLDRADSLITEFKGAGIMHPRPNLVTEMMRVKAPIYELNPSLFAEKHRREM